MSRAGINKCVAEGVGTFALVFVGTGAIVTNDLYGGLVTHVGISFAFGVTVMAVIYAIGDRSGAHINPAVTLAFWVAKRLPGREVPGYLAAQFCGAFLASALLRTLFSDHETLARVSQIRDTGCGILRELADFTRESPTHFFPDPSGGNRYGEAAAWAGST